MKFIIEVKKKDTIETDQIAWLEDFIIQYQYSSFLLEDQDLENLLWKHDLLKLF